eukprot:g14660.t1
MSRPSSAPPEPGFLGNLSPEQQAALVELESLLQGSASSSTTPPTGRTEDGASVATVEVEDFSRHTLWGCPLHAKSDARDIVLLKFLRAEEFDAARSWHRLQQTLSWRRDNRIDALAANFDKLPQQFQNHDHFCGFDRNEGRPVLVSHFGGMDLASVFGDTDLFVKYRVAVMERAIARLLPFEKGSPETLFQVHDYKNCPVLFKDKTVSSILGGVNVIPPKPMGSDSVACQTLQENRCLLSGQSMHCFDMVLTVDQGVKAISKVLADHYPEFKGKTCFVNFPDVVELAWKAAALLLVPEKTAKKLAFLGGSNLLPLLDDLSALDVDERLGGLGRYERSADGTPAWEERQQTVKEHFEKLRAVAGAEYSEQRGIAIGGGAEGPPPVTPGVASKPKEIKVSEDSGIVELAARQGSLSINMRKGERILLCMRSNADKETVKVAGVRLPTPPPLAETVEQEDAAAEAPPPDEVESSLGRQGNRTSPQELQQALLSACGENLSKPVTLQFESDADGTLEFAFADTSFFGVSRKCVVYGYQIFRGGGN